MTGRKQSKPELPPLVLLGDGAEEDYKRGDPEVFVPSGIEALDKVILGAVAGELLLLAGDAGQGKTSLAVQWIASNAANGNASAMLSLEMTRTALRNRLVSSMTGVQMRTLRTRQWGEGEQAAVLEAARWLNTLPLYVDDRGGLDASEVYKTIVSWADRGITLGVVDYVQQMSGANESRVTQVGDAVRAIKAAAKDANLPIIGISSLNRTGSAGGGTPKKHWLRDSGDLEFVADTILMLYYPEEDDNEDVRACDIHVLKQRNGPTGVASVRFDKTATRFFDQ